MSSLREGMSMCWHMKYSVTQKEVTGQSNMEPSSSDKIYAPPLLHEIMIRGSRYLAYTLQLSDFSIVMFLIKMRSLSLKL